MRHLHGTNKRDINKEIKKRIKRENKEIGSVSVKPTTLVPTRPNSRFRYARVFPHFVVF
uniref:Uncharacterized protein n=1 Tax=Meloidogyne enterolobii TaxID=390850 RepID=A0A6V7UCU0_MELEN|nr:unnamed protein product [Meloidogyne enterolobii]